MRDRRKQRELKKTKEKGISIRDSAGVVDPTPYEAVQNILAKEKKEIIKEWKKEEKNYLYSMELFRSVLERKNIYISRNDARKMSYDCVQIKDIISAFYSGEIILRYTRDLPLPGCVIRGISDRMILHMYVSMNEECIYVSDISVAEYLEKTDEGDGEEE